jgi:hypothetical protein
MQRSRHTPGTVLEHVFSHENPGTGSQPPEHMAWVVFASGTAFFSEPSDELPRDARGPELIRAAKIALEELGPVIPGTPSADFNPVLLDDWFPGEFIYFVSYDHPSVATIVIADEDDALAAGLEARARRNADHELRRVVEIRDFSGKVSRPALD